MKRFVSFLVLFLFSIYISFGQSKKDWENKLNKAEAIFEDYNNSKISIAALVVNNDTVQYIKKFGEESTDYSQLFGLGKISKYFTAVSILKLVERGEVKLSDNLSKYFSEFSGFADSITVEELLVHKSGLPFLPQNINCLSKKETDEFLKNSTLKKDYIGKTIYNDLDYYLLSRIIDKKYKKGYAQFIKKEILKPIGIKNVIIIDHSFNNFEALPVGYVMRDSVFQELKPAYNRILQGASGIFISIEDLSKFIISLNKGELISKELGSNLYSVSYLDDSKNESRGMYGLNGIKESVYRTNYFYDGGFSDFGSQSAIRIPVVNVNVILLTNQPGVFGLRKKTILLSNIFSGKFLYPGK
jgi:CubicO group peptidase (beta-lactamase class C family)